MGGYGASAGIVCMRMGLMLLTSSVDDSIHQPLQEVAACDEPSIFAPPLLNFADTLYSISSGPSSPKHSIISGGSANTLAIGWWERLKDRGYRDQQAQANWARYLDEGRFVKIRSAVYAVADDLHM